LRTYLNNAYELKLHMHT